MCRELAILDKVLQDSRGRRELALVSPDKAASDREARISTTPGKQELVSVCQVKAGSVKAGRAP